MYQRTDTDPVINRSVSQLMHHSTRDAPAVNQCARLPSLARLPHGDVRAHPLARPALVSNLPDASGERLRRFLETGFLDQAHIDRIHNVFHIGTPPGERSPPASRVKLAPGKIADNISLLSNLYKKAESDSPCATIGRVSICTVELVNRAAVEATCRRIVDNVLSNASPIVGFEYGKDLLANPPQPTGSVYTYEVGADGHPARNALEAAHIVSSFDRMIQLYDHCALMRCDNGDNPNCRRRYFLGSVHEVISDVTQAKIVIKICSHVLTPDTVSDVVDMGLELAWASLAADFKIGPRNMGAALQIDQKNGTGPKLAVSYLMMPYIPLDLAVIETILTKLYADKIPLSEEQEKFNAMRKQIRGSIATSMEDVLMKLWNDCGLVHLDLHPYNVRFNIPDRGEGGVGIDGAALDAESPEPMLIDYGSMATLEQLQPAILSGDKSSVEFRGGFHVEMEVTFENLMQESAMDITTFKSLVGGPYKERREARLNARKEANLLSKDDYEWEISFASHMHQLCNVLEGKTLEFVKDAEGVVTLERRVTAAN